MAMAQDHLDRNGNQDRESENPLNVYIILTSDSTHL